LSLGTRGGEHEGRLQEHIDDLGRLDMSSRTAAERVTMEWLKERVECRKRGAKAPPKGFSHTHTSTLNFREFIFQDVRE
jgi:hypothetical protein